MAADYLKGSFAELITTAMHGAIDNDATSEMKKLIAEMQYAQRNRTGVPQGKLLLDLTFELNDKGGVEITSKVKRQQPPIGKTRVFMFVHRDGTLSTEDERQTSLDLNPKDPSAKAATPRDVHDPRMAQANDV